MRQTGDWKKEVALIPEGFKELLTRAVNNLDVDQASREVELFVKNPANLSVWSREFFWTLLQG